MLLIMTKEMMSKAKPLSFSTTMRNPDRIALFLNQILPFENHTLTDDVIMDIVRNIIKNKLYKPYYIDRNNNLKEIFYDDDLSFSDDQVEEIIINSPQKHKEAGFEYGWSSRFDTWYSLPKEFGFLYYEMNKPIKISNIGHMLIDALNEETPNSKKIQNVFLNSLMKYSTDNPFRKNSNSNVPLLLLLKVIGLLKNDEEENGAGVFRQELSLFICWKDDDANRLYKKIKEIRKNVKFTYSDEYIYDICLEELGCITDEEKQNSKKYYNMSMIFGEAVDEYIRKMRSTGLLSLRGNGRFLDYNSFEQKKIDYVLKNYSEYIKFENRESYYKYIGEIDNNILVIEEEDNIPKKDEVKLDTLRRLAKEYSKDFIFNELMLVSGKKESSDKLLKFISGPIRLEFLTSIALVQNFNDIMVLPSYPVDDEGLPTMTAGGDTPDIVCYDGEYDSLFEVTLMCGRSDQVNNEIIPIRRHLLERIKKNNNSFSVFVAPIIHEDTKEAIEWYKHKDNVDIIPYTILEMIEEFKIKNNLGELLN